MGPVIYRSEVKHTVIEGSGHGSKMRSEVNETIFEAIGQYVAAVFDDVMPDYVIIGDGKNYSSNITNVSYYYYYYHTVSGKM